MTFYPSEQPTPWLPMLIKDVSGEHSHRRTAVVADDEESAVHADSRRPPRPRRRLIGLLAATALAAGLVAVTVGIAPAATSSLRPATDFRLGPGLAQPPGYIR